MQDASNSFRQPFIKITNLSDSSEAFSGINGLYLAAPGDRLEFEHFLFQPKQYIVNHKDTIQYVALRPIEIHDLNLSDDSTGRTLFRQFQDSILVRGYDLMPYLKYELVNTLELESQKMTKKNPPKNDQWDQYLSLINIEEVVSEGTGKNMIRTLYTHVDTKDTVILFRNRSSLIPSILQNITPFHEYIALAGGDFYNPLYHGADGRYIQYYLGQLRLMEDSLDVVLSLPKGSRKFASVIALLYFDSKTKGLKGSSYYPAKSLTDWQLNCDYINLNSMIALHNNVYFESHLKNVPRKSYTTLNKFYSAKDKFEFTKDSITVRKTDIRIFQSRKDSIQQAQDEYYNVQPISDHEKLQYLNKDTSKSKFIRRGWYDILVNMAIQNLGLKFGKGYFNNIFKINGYELLRIGVGYQSVNLISERLRFGGYVGYAINPEGDDDNGWRFGFNTGVYLGKGKKQYMDFNYKNDVMEPGRTFYLYEKKDLIRNFFTSRMGRTISYDAAYTSTVNKNFIFRVNHTNYSFDPQFYYWYKPTPEDSTNFFRFTEMGFKMRLGRYATMYPALSRLLLLKKKFIPTVYFNYIRGFDNILEGEYAYNKFNLKIKSLMQFNEMFHLDFTAEGGISDKDIPYPVAFLGAGNITGLASIMVQDAFQTMNLYDYLSDQYLNLFTTFYVNFKARKRYRMRPQVGLAWNMGWGKLDGNPDVHVFEEGEGIRDYRDGFYEVGVLFTNFLQIRLLGLVRGEFGMGVFYNVGPTEDNRLAFRATYRITPL